MTATYAAVNNPLHTAAFTMKAGEAIAANHLVKLDSTEGQVVNCSAITDVPVGVAIQTVASGESVSIQMFGIAKLVAAGSVSLGAQLMPYTSPTGTVATASGATAVSCAVALQDAADTATFTALLAPVPVKGPANS